MTLRIKSIIALVMLVMTLAIVGCGSDSGGSPMPDNAQPRKENGQNNRGDQSTGGAAPSSQLGKE